MKKNMWQFENVEQYLETAMEKIKKTAVRMDGMLPGYYHDDRGEWRAFSPGGWTDSFFPGMLYLSYLKSKAPFFLESARSYDQAFTDLLENNKGKLDHDLGFLYTLKDVFDYQISGSEAARTRALCAAEELVRRYNPVAKIIPAWNFHPMQPEVDYRGRIIADTMLNLPLLCWAYTQTQDERYYEAAFQHGQTAQSYLVREDGSSFHVYDFEPETGKPLRGGTMQGYADDSCWSRGQAWVLYGFALLYKNTGHKPFLQTAMKAAAYFIEHTPAYGVPLWDFAVSGLNYAPWDSSAGAVTVCGLLEICRHLPEKEERNYYYQNAIRMMYGLTELCATLDTCNMEPLLLHGCGAPAYRKGAEQILATDNPDIPTIFGDYYYMEALMRLADESVPLPW